MLPGRTPKLQNKDVKYMLCLGALLLTRLSNWRMPGKIRATLLPSANH
jgi:hypothetical protein